MYSEIIWPQARLGRWNTVGCSMKFIVNAWHTGLLTNGSVGRLLRDQSCINFWSISSSLLFVCIYYRSLYQTDISDSGIVRWHPRICNYFISLWFKWEIPSFVAFSLRYFSTINPKHRLGLTNTAYSLALASEGKRMISIYGLFKAKILIVPHGYTTDVGVPHPAPTRSVSLKTYVAIMGSELMDTAKSRCSARW